MDTKNIKDFPEILQINDNTRLLGIGNNNIGDGAKITIDRLISQSISPSENNLLSLDDNNKLFVPKSGEIVFNNPFAFGDFKYSDHVISNLSWLRSNGQRNSGTFYERYYNWLLALYNGEEAIAGISVKSVNDSSATDYDYKIDTNSREFILPTETVLHPIDSSVNAPVVGNGMTLGFTDGAATYGFGTYGTNAQNNDMFRTSNYGKSVGEAFTSSGTMPSSKCLGITTDSTKSGIEAKLSSAKANAYLYYFVGDVIQSANLIDVARLEEQVTDLQNNKLNIDLSNASATFKSKISSYSIPNYSRSVNIASSGYVAEENGYIIAIMQSTGNDPYHRLFVNGVEIYRFSRGGDYGGGKYKSCLFPIAKGDTFTWSFTQGTMTSAKFIYLNED